MRPRVTVLRCFLLVFAASTVLAAEPVPRPVANRAQVDQQLMALAQRQVELAFTLRDQIQKNDALWLDPKYTSPEIEKLRQHLADLQKEQAALQNALRKLVAEVPEARAELEKAEAAKAEHQALARRIDELRKLREQMP